MIELQRVFFSYEDASRSALHDVSFTVHRGELFAVVGHNGSGKSTLAKHLNGLLLPMEGRVLVDGMDTKEEDKILCIRQRVGMVFQNPDNQLVTTIVEEDVAFGPENLGVEPAEIRKRVDEALVAVGMEEYAARAPHMLSGGQKQRIAIAGMLAMRPEVLVLDEATAMLDPEGRRDVLSTVKKLNREKGMTVILITQFMEEAAECDWMAVMDHGRLAMLGAPKEIFRRGEELAAMGLGVPAMVRIRDSLPIELPGEPIDTEDMADALMPWIEG